MATDGRACALDIKRKLALADKVIDHVVDGDTAPAVLYKKLPGGKTEPFLHDIWTLAAEAVRKEWKAVA